MSKTHLLRIFVNERLTAAADEIFGVFERTIVKYEEEVSRSQQEIERQRKLLDVLLKQNAVPTQLPVTKETNSIHQLSDQQHCEQGYSFGLVPEDPEPAYIKEEKQEFNTSQEEEMLQEFKDGTIVQLILSPPSPRVNDDQTPASSLQPQNENSDVGCEVGENGGLLSCFNKPRSMNNVTRQLSHIPSRTCTDSFHVKSVKSNHCCHLCKKAFSYRQHLLNHVHRVHSKNTDMCCGVCGKSLDSNDSLVVHLNSHINTRNCHVCGKHFTNNSSLLEHMTSHTGVKPHRCHVCGRECSRKGDLKIHMRIHTGEKPFCCTFCGKGFTHSGHLKKHLRSHTGERPYRCDVCGRDFTQSVHLKHHMKTHA